MAKTKTENKQISKQNVNVYIGEKAVKRRRGKPRKRRAKGSGFVVQNTFTSPIINYPPTYVNPAVVQPVQQPQLSTLIPKVPAGAPPATQPRLGLVSRATLTDFPEGETAPTLGLDPTKRVKVKVEEEEKPRPVSAFSAFDRRLVRESQEAKLATYRTPTRLKKSKPKPQPTAENALGGRDTNLGDAVEIDTPASRVFNPRTVLPPIRQPVFAEGVWIPPGPNIVREKTPPRSRKPKGIKPPDFPPPDFPPPDFPPPSELSPAIAVRLKKDGTPDKRYLKKAERQALEQGPVEPLFPPPEEAFVSSAPSPEGIRFLGSTRRPTSAPPTIERQREQAIPPTEQANFL